MKLDEYYTVEDVAEKLKISKGSVYVRMHRGDFPIPYVKIGRLVRFSGKDIEAYPESLPRIEPRE